MIAGREFHPIIQNIFGDVRGYDYSEQVQVNCPKCQERDFLQKPDGKFNLEINTAKKVFRCWKCDEPKFSGSLGRLIRMYGSHTDYQLYKSYSTTFDFSFKQDEEIETVQVQLPLEYIPFSQIDTKNPHHMEAYKYLVFERKIDYEKIIKYKIGFCVEGKYRDRIVFPSYDNEGELNYFITRAFKNIKPPYLNPDADKNQIIFNEGYINWDSTIYLVEGIFDYLSLVNGIILLGKTLSDKLFLLLKEKKPPLVVALDPDAFTNAYEIFNKINAIYVGLEDRIKIVKLNGDMDVDEIRRKVGHDELINKLYGARKLEVEDYFHQKKYVKRDVKTKYRFRTNN